MPYHPNIPQPNDDPQFSQQDLLENYGSLATQIAVNHIPLTGAIHNGWHSKIFFDNPLTNTSDPNLIAPLSSLYPKVSDFGTTQLYFQNNTTPASVKQLTNLPLRNGTITLVQPDVPVPGTVTITSPNHGLTSGNSIVIRGLYGSTQLNGNTYNVTVTGINTFTVVQAGVSAYVSDTGYWTITGSTRFGIKTPWGQIWNFGSTTSLSPTVNFAYPYPPLSGIWQAQSSVIGSIGSSAPISSVTNETIIFSPVGAPPTIFYLVIGSDV